MARDLDTLIRHAQASEAPSPGDRARVRESLAQRIAGEPLPPNAATAGRLPIVGASVLAVAAAAGIAIAIGSSFGARLQASGYEPQASSNAPPASSNAPQASSDAEQPSDVDASPARAPAEPLPSAVAEPGEPEQPDLLAQPLVPAEPLPTAATEPGEREKAEQPEALARPRVPTEPRDEPRAESRALPALRDPLGELRHRYPRLKPPLPPLDFKGLTRLEAESRYLAETERYLRQGGILPIVTVMLIQQDRMFRQGALQAERDALRVLAFCAAGQVQEAKDKADTFLREHPTSPLRARVLGSCVKSGSESPSKAPSKSKAP